MLSQKPPFIFMSDLDFDENKFIELISSNSLFAEKFSVILNNVLEDKDIKSFIFNKLDDIKNSENIFVFLENKALKDTLAKFEKVEAEIKKFELSTGKIASVKEFNIFSLADAFGRRDKKNAWLIFQEAVAKNIAPEAISGMIFWKIKTLILSKSKFFSDLELKKMSSKLISIYHESRRSNQEPLINLEKFILESL